MLGRHSPSVDKKPRTTWACDQWEQWTQNSLKLMAAGVMSQLPLEYPLQDLYHPEKQKQLLGCISNMTIVYTTIFKVFLQKNDYLKLIIY
jgi:hypothetical protein